MLPSTEFDCGNASLYKSKSVCSFNKRTYVYRKLDTTATKVAVVIFHNVQATKVTVGNRISFTIYASK